MITTNGRQEIAACDVFPDDTDPLHFYVCPQGPRIALDEKGKPVFSLVWYRRDLKKLTDDQRKTQLGGGILAVSVELRTTPDQDKTVRDTLSGNPDLQRRTRLDKDKLSKSLTFDALPVSEGSVTIAILAETPDATHPGEFASSLIGVGGVSMTGRERASFMAKLTQDGVVLLWEMIEKNLPAIRIAYDLTYNYRIDGVEMRAWCNGSKAYKAIQEQWDDLTEHGSFSEVHDGGNTTLSAAHGKTDSAKDILSTALSSEETAGVSVVPSAGADVVKPELIAELTEQGNSMIKDFLASTFLEVKVGEDFKPDEDAPDGTLATELPKYGGDRPYGSDSINNYNLKKYTETVTANLDYRMKNKAVVTSHLRPNDNLGNVLDGHKVDDLRVRIDIDDVFYRFLDVQVVCTADFDDDPISLVKAHLSYTATGSAGKITSVGDVLFQKGANAPQRFSTYLAGPDKVQYHWDLEVFYKGSTANFKKSGATKETILVLDVDALGVLKVDIIAGIVDWTNIQQIFLELSCGDDHKTQFVLNSQAQTKRWTEVMAIPEIPDYTYTATFVDKSGQRMVVGPFSTSTKTLILNQPETEQLEVLAIAAGNYGSGGLINQVAVAIRYSDTANNYDAHTEFMLSKQGDSKLWAAPLIDKTLKTYQYKITVFYTDGLTREDVWRTSDNPVLPVGDPFGFKVTMLPYLYRSGAWAFGTIDMSFDDGAVHAQKTFEIKDFTTPLVWQFRLNTQDHHTYKYQVTMYKADGTQVVGPSSSDSKDVLVIPMLPG